MADHYGIASLAEARAYLEHPVLGPRLRECVRVLCALPGVTAREVLGEVDALKFRSCLTLFKAVEGAGPAFEAALGHFFEGEEDRATLDLLAMAPGLPE